MKRLKDEWRSNDPRLRAAARMLHDVPAVSDGPQRRRLVRMKMRRPSRTRARPLRAALAVAAMFLLGAAGAGAMAEGGWRATRDRVSAWLHPAPAVSRPVRLAVARPRVAPAPVVPVAPPAPVVAVAPPVVDVAPPRPRRAVAARASARPAVAAPIAVVSPPAAPNPEAELMMQAIAARRAGELDRAARLLARYRQEFPHGMFEEEALVLSIEAAAPSRPSEADALSGLYLQRFPSGRFRARVAGGMRAAPP